MEILVVFKVAQIGNVSFNFGQIWGVVFIVVALLYILLNKVKLNLTKMHLSLTFLLLFSLIPVFFFTHDFIFGLVKFSKWLVWIFALYVLFDVFKSRKHFRLFEKYISKIGGFIVFVYLMGYFISKIFGMNVLSDTDFQLYSYAKYEIGFKSIFYGTHALSLLSIFILMLIFIKNSFVKKLGNFELFLVIALSLIVISVLARTGIVAILILYLIMFRRKKKLFYIFSISAVIVMVFSFNQDILQRRLLKDYYAYSESDKGYYALGSGRFGMWDAIFKYYVEQHEVKKLIGSGFDADFRATGKYFVRRGSHNDFLDLLINTGLISLILYVSFLYYCFKIVFNNPRLRGHSKAKNIFHAIFFSTVTIMLFQGLTMSVQMFYFIIVITYGYGKIISINSINNNVKV